jgi:hypothetical protein
MNDKEMLNVLKQMADAMNNKQYEKVNNLNRKLNALLLKIPVDGVFFEYDRCRTSFVLAMEVLQKKPDSYEKLYEFYINDGRKGLEKLMKKK